MEELLPLNGRVLSVQSHVVHGYVGNKSAVFPLQLLGFEVDPISSVQFSNHTGYRGGFRGEVLDGAQLLALTDGLSANGLMAGYTHLLTGYIGSVSFLRAVAEVLRQLRAVSPSLRYHCDPVMGDHGRLYVAPDLVDVYRRELVPLATVLTPNRFECELLTGTAITTEADACRACSLLHAVGVRTVVLTSCSLGGGEGGGPERYVLLASALGDRGGAHEVHRVVMTKHPGEFTGTGDLVAALLLAWMARNPENLAVALESACATMDAVIRRTSTAIEAGSNPNREILIIQSRAEIERPPRRTTRDAQSEVASLLCAQRVAPVLLGAVLSPSALRAGSDDDDTLQALRALRRRGLRVGVADAPESLRRRVLAEAESGELRDVECLESGIGNGALLAPAAAASMGLAPERLLLLCRDDEEAAAERACGCFAVSAEGAAKEDILVRMLSALAESDKGAVAAL